MGETLLDIADQREPIVITQNGEHKSVLQDIASFEQTQETLALLELLAMSNRDIEAGHSKPAHAVIARLKSKSAQR